MGPISKSTIRTSFVLGIRLLVQAGTLLLVARLLGASDYGLFAGIAALAVLMGTFSTFGTHLVLLSEVSKSPKLCTQILSYAVPTTLIFGCGLFLLYMLICWLFFYGLSPSLVMIVCIGITEILLLPLFLLSTIEELALGETAKSQLWVIFPLALRTLAVEIVLLVDTSEPLILFCWLYIGSAVVALCCRKFFKPNAWLKIKEWRLANRQELKNSAGYAALAITAAGPTELDKMLAVKLLPLGMSGVYIAAARVMGAVALPIMALLLAALPKLFKTNDTSVNHSLRLNIWIIITVLIYGVLISGILWWIAPWIESIFGSQYQGMIALLRWFCYIIPLLLLRISLANILMSMNKPWLRVLIEVIGMLILILSSIFFCLYFNLLGIIFALFVSEFFMVIANTLIIYYKLMRSFSAIK
ncbi:lipopolysaccharide biosynthesis protein [Acinetobacter cumulans]|uniref:Lipopolysaccharide biosynthesis protein n=1 Tax=Acinetobacter cumulans TaxID=2136182 RepID=A0A498D4T9_9GAMM|nr:oligosaccharide flippase family protein [Acinetobacter cumulans]RLL38307.1 lipopolysaccharide biosynthesis protein [Acinetobacter cumulans]